MLTPPVDTEGRLDQSPREVGRRVAPDLGPSAEYDTDWASEVERTGVAAYYPPLDM
jgi:hypothetical protein